MLLNTLKTLFLSVRVYLFWRRKSKATGFQFYAHALARSPLAVLCAIVNYWNWRGRMTRFASSNRLISLRQRLAMATLPLISAVVLIASLCLLTGASEFPERECCDLPPLPDVDVRLQPASTTAPSLSSLTTEMPPHSSEHPDTSNFLYPEFIPELSLDLGYPLPPPPLHPPHHQHPQEGGNYVPTTTGTGTQALNKKSIHPLGSKREGTGEIWLERHNVRTWLEMRVLRISCGLSLTPGSCPAWTRDIFIGHNINDRRGNWSMARTKIDKKRS